MSYTNKNVLTNTKATSKNPRRRLWFIIGSGVAAVIIVGVVLVLAFHHNNRTPATTASSATKGEPVTSSSDNNATSPATPGTNTNPTSPTSGQSGATDNPDKSNTPDTSATLLDPSGNFVSNHHPNLSGHPAPNEIQSVCNTTPGASCQIVFTKDGVSKSLPAQKVDPGGATYWTWKLQDYGITAGSWQVQARASLGSQTKTADDALALEVAQ